MDIVSDNDRFTVVNGPEDGNEYRIMRAPFDIGSDPACSVMLRLDRDVEPVHAHISVVDNGYRVRAAGGARCRVNGKRVGLYRSRVLREGDSLMVGHSILTLHCAPRGLSARSRGMVAESDLAYVARSLSAGARRIAGIFLLRHGRVVVPLGVAAALALSPTLRMHGLNFLVWVWDRIGVPSMQ